MLGSDRNAARPTGMTAAAFVLATGLLLVPFMLFDYMPIVDMPNHMARHHIAALTVAGGEVSPYYGYEFRLIPNAAVDLVGRLLDYGARPYASARVVTAFYVVNFMASVMLLHRVAWGKWSLWPLWAALFVYNGSLRWGFENYLFAMPFAIHGLTLWIMCKTSPIWWRICLFPPLALALYFGHAVAFGLFAASVAGRELYLLVERRGRGYSGALLLVLTTAPPILHLLLSQGDQAALEDRSTSFGGVWSRVQALIHLTSGGPASIDGPGPYIAAAIAPLLVAAPLLLVVLGAGRIRLARASLGPVAVLAVLFLVLPFKLLGIDFVNTRAAPFLAAVAVALTSFEMFRPRIRRQFAWFALLLIAIRVAVYVAEFRAYNRDVEELRAHISTIPVGARIVALDDAADLAPSVKHHMASLAVIERGAFASGLFEATTGLFIRDEWIALRPNSPRLQTVQEVGQKSVDATGAGARDWRLGFTHVLLIHGDGGKLAPMLGLRLVSEGSAFTLFETCPRDCE